MRKEGGITSTLCKHPLPPFILPFQRREFAIWSQQCLSVACFWVPADQYFPKHSSAVPELHIRHLELNNNRILSVLAERVSVWKLLA